MGFRTPEDTFQQRTTVRTNNWDNTEKFDLARVVFLFVCILLIIVELISDQICLIIERRIK